MKNTTRIIKSKQEHDFTILPNDLIRNDKITLRARALLAYLISLPDTWVIYKSKIHIHMIEGRDAIMKAFDELIEARYILVSERRNSSGQIEGYDYTIYSQPVPENPLSVKPVPEKPLSDNQAFINNYTNKESINKESIKGNSEKDSNSSGKEKKKEAKFKKAQKPDSIEQVAEYMKTQNIVDPEFHAKKFWSHYGSIGWMRGKNKIKDWRLCVATWDLPKLPTIDSEDIPITPEVKMVQQDVKVMTDMFVNQAKFTKEFVKNFSIVALFFYKRDGKLPIEILEFQPVMQWTDIQFNNLEDNERELLTRQLHQAI